MMQRLATTAMLCLITSAGQALAQAPYPMGFWSTADGSERLLVQGSQCSFAAYGGVQVAGDCTWEPTSRGGILAIWYPMPLGPEAVRYNVVWIDNNTISVWGDIFYRQ